ncbi:MAG: GatB/YqeY domain-containing protein [Gammaproteobacteria bacterium]
MSALKDQIGEAVKDAMRARAKERLGALRLISAEIKRVEVDTRKTLTDDDVLSILNKMLKQRQDSVQQFEAAGREDLAAVERAEIAVIREFMPEPLSEDALSQEIENAIAQSGAATMKDMGALMAVLRPRVQGRADMGVVSARVKARLTN